MPSMWNWRAESPWEGVGLGGYHERPGALLTPLPSYPSGSLNGTSAQPGVSWGEEPPIMETHLCGLGIWQTWVWIQLASLMRCMALGKILVSVSFFLLKWRSLCLSYRLWIFKNTTLMLLLQWNCLKAMAICQYIAACQISTDSVTWKNTTIFIMVLWFRGPWGFSVAEIKVSAGLCSGGSREEFCPCLSSLWR